ERKGQRGTTGGWSNSKSMATVALKDKAPAAKPNDRSTNGEGAAGAGAGARAAAGAAATATPASAATPASIETVAAPADAAATDQERRNAEQSKCEEEFPSHRVQPHLCLIAQEARSPTWI